MQAFKGDAIEQKMTAAFSVPLTLMDESLDEFFDGLYSCVPMGEFLYDNRFVTITHVMDREVFSDVFSEIFQSWGFPGTFNSYILIFKKIFGDDTEIVFTVPDPGRLQIDITANNLALFFFISQEIVDNEYVFSNMVDDEGDNILFDGIPGIQSEDELQKIINIMAVDGIFLEVTLTLGEE
jgi:hypothetical protein